MGGLGGSGGGPSTRAQQTVVAVRDSPDDLNKSLMRTTKSELIAHSRPLSSQLNVGSAGLGGAARSVHPAGPA